MKNLLQHTACTLLKLLAVLCFDWFCLCCLFETKACKSSNTNEAHSFTNYTFMHCGVIWKWQVLWTYCTWTLWAVDWVHMNQRLSWEYEGIDRHQNGLLIQKSLCSFFCSHNFWHIECIFLVLNSTNIQIYPPLKRRRPIISYSCLSIQKECLFTGLLLYKTLGGISFTQPGFNRSEKSNLESDNISCWSKRKVGIMIWNFSGLCPQAISCYSFITSFRVNQLPWVQKTCPDSQNSHF